LDSDKERALATRLIQFDEAISNVAAEGTPHVLCAYLYDIATLFSSFYEHCPILAAENEELKLSRLKLASLTAKTLKTGLDMLGIKTVDKM
jgi:Arginyl-tRNA synthetase